MKFTQVLTPTEYLDSHVCSNIHDTVTNLIIEMPSTYT